MKARDPIQRIGRRSSEDDLLFLTDEKLLEGIELLFFAYRDFTGDPDRILEEMDLGRAHHRAIHFIGRREGVTVAGLLEVLGITKQSLNRVLKTLIRAGFVEQKVGAHDRRTRLLFLTENGKALERRLSEPQRLRMRDAFRSAGPEAVRGFRRVLELMTNDLDAAGGAP